MHNTISEGILHGKQEMKKKKMEDNIKPNDKSKINGNKKNVKHELR